MGRSGLNPRINLLICVRLRLIWSFIRVNSCPFAVSLFRRLLCAGWFLCFLRPRVFERDRPIEDEVFRRTFFVQGEVADALKLVPGLAARLPQAWFAFSRNDFE